MAYLVGIDWESGRQETFATEDWFYVWERIEGLLSRAVDVWINGRLVHAGFDQNFVGPLLPIESGITETKYE